MPLKPAWLGRLNDYLFAGYTKSIPTHGPPQIKAPGGRKRLSLIQMILLTHFKAGFRKKRLTVVARLVTNDGLTALLLNANVFAEPSKPPLNVLAETADNSLFRR